MKLCGFRCPSCGHDKYLREYEEDQLYVCAKCGQPVCYHCDTCENMYEDMKRLAFYNGAYVCKKCGKIQWGYTEFMRNKIGES